MALVDDFTCSQLCVRSCMRWFYDPHSQYLTDHYRLGQQLGKGNFGEVRAARLRLKAHTYSKRVVGKNQDALTHMKESQAAGDVDHSQGAKPSGNKVAPDRDSEVRPEAMSESVKSTASEAEGKTHRGSITISQQRRANFDKHHYAQGLMDWPYACKIIKKSRVNVASIMKEIQILDACQHDCVLEMVEHFESSSELYMVMGRCYSDVEKAHKECPGGVDIKRVEKWVAQLIAAVAYCHSIEIVHRDIKMPNMMLTSTRADANMVLGDFGFADYEQTLIRETTDICGTPLTLAPEVMDGHPQKRPTDIWSCGITAYEMVACEHPFSNPKMQKAVATAIKKEKQKPQQLSPEDETEHQAFGVMRSSCVMARDGANKKKIDVVKVVDSQDDRGAYDSQKKGKAQIRKAEDFKKVASRFSTNERFVQRFQELAVAVTSEGLEVNYSNPRFQESPVLRQVVDMMLTRSPSRRLPAESLKTTLPVPAPKEKGKDGKAAWS